MVLGKWAHFLKAGLVLVPNKLPKLPFTEKDTENAGNEQICLPQMWERMELRCSDINETIEHSWNELGAQQGHGNHFLVAIHQRAVPRTHLCSIRVMGALTCKWGCDSVSYPSLTTIHVVIFKNDTQKEVTAFVTKWESPPVFPWIPGMFITLLQLKA